jgi:hypothetical protein
MDLQVGVTNEKKTIFSETYQEDKLMEEYQNSILEEMGRVFRGAPIGELPHLKSYRLEVNALIHMRRPTVWSMAHQSY